MASDCPGSTHCRSPPLSVACLSRMRFLKRRWNRQLEDGDKRQDLNAETDRSEDGGVCLIALLNLSLALS
jgi:hypothetical protein